MRLWGLLVSLAAAVSHASSHSIEGQVFPNQKPVEGWRARARVVLNNGLKETFLTPDGTFVFKDVESGWHIVEVISPDYVYNTVRMEILETGFTRATYANWLSMVASPNIEYPLKIRPVMAAEYFQKREGFSPLDMLKNPMVLMMLFMGGMAFVMPKMMEGLDQEQLEEMRGKPIANEAWEELNREPKAKAVTGGTPQRASSRTSGKKAAGNKR